MDAISSKLPVDPTLYAQFEKIQTAQTPQPKPLSKPETVEAICQVYEKLIELAKHRQQSPVRLQTDEKWTYVHTTEGGVTTIRTKKYDFISDFSLEEYEKEENKLIKQLADLDAYTYMASLIDAEDSVWLNKIMDLCQKWSELGQANSDRFNEVNEELEKLKLADQEEGFTET
jgi:hypothetical protein